MNRRLPIAVYVALVAVVGAACALVLWLNVLSKPQSLSEEDAKTRAGIRYDACIAKATKKATRMCARAEAPIDPKKCQYAAKLKVDMCSNCVAKNKGLWDSCYELYSAATGVTKEGEGGEGEEGAN